MSYLLVGEDMDVCLATVPAALRGSHDQMQIVRLCIPQHAPHLSINIAPSSHPTQPHIPSLPPSLPWRARVHAREWQAGLSGTATHTERGRDKPEL